MAKLSKEVLAEGRALVRAGDMRPLMDWVRKHAPVGLDHALYERALRPCLLGQDYLRALKFHNIAFEDYDPDVHRLAAWLGKAIWCGIILAVVCGIFSFFVGVVALIRWLF
jgi:hypothetical protein